MAATTRSTNRSINPGFSIPRSLKDLVVTQARLEGLKPSAMAAQLLLRGLDSDESIRRREAGNL